MLRQTGADVWRIGFNAGDSAFWFHPDTYIPFQGTAQEWPQTFINLIEEKSVTDIVLYGDTRPIHAVAVKIAKRLGLRIHVFEEGYLRPFWVTYERDGTNGNSRLMEMPVSVMESIMANNSADPALPPARWGDMRQHIFYGALYHWFVMFRNKEYPNFKPHRSLTVKTELQLYLKRLLLMPLHAIHRRIATMRIKYGGFPYHLVLLQLEHDSSFQMHSPFKTMPDFIELVIEGFAKGAPKHHHLVFKAHPLEDDRSSNYKNIRALARKYGIKERVHYVGGGKLAQLLNETRTAVTVNSTAAQQALWRGIPLKVFGRAIYTKPEFVSGQPLAEFFQNPARPDINAYKNFRQYLLETSQLAGGYYSARGRRQLLRQVVDMMLALNDPYDMLKSGTATPRQHLRIVD